MGNDAELGGGGPAATSDDAVLGFSEQPLSSSAEAAAGPASSSPVLVRGLTPFEGPEVAATAGAGREGTGAAAAAEAAETRRAAGLSRSIASAPWGACMGGRDGRPAAPKGRMPAAAAAAAVASAAAAAAVGEAEGEGEGDSRGAASRAAIAAAAPGEVMGTGEEVAAAGSCFFEEGLPGGTGGGGRGGPAVVLSRGVEASTSPMSPTLNQLPLPPAAAEALLDDGSRSGSGVPPGEWAVYDCEDSVGAISTAVAMPPPLLPPFVRDARTNGGSIEAPPPPFGSKGIEAPGGCTARTASPSGPAAAPPSFAPAPAAAPHLWAATSGSVGSSLRRSDSEGNGPGDWSMLCATGTALDIEPVRRWAGLLPPGGHSTPMRARVRNQRRRRTKWWEMHLPEAGSRL